MMGTTSPSFPIETRYRTEIMWCSCTGGGRRGFKKIDADLWGCEICSQPTRAVFNKLTSMRAPLDSVALISVFSRADGINEITFALRGGTKETVLEMAGKPTVLERLWIELDTTMDSLMNVAGVPNPDEGVVQSLRIRARTQAETLAILMTPFFSNADEIAREAKRRFDARKKGDSGYVTPGIAGEEYVPPAPKISTRSPASAEQTNPTNRTTNRTNTDKSQPRAAQGKTLPPDAIPTIKQGIEMGMFTTAQIAKSYGVSEDEVKRSVEIA